MARPGMQRAIALARKVWYAGRGEQINLCGHRLRYVPGTRPTRLKYRNDPDLTVRNDVQQLEFFGDNVRPGESVMDVGANVGQYTILLGALVGPSGAVAAFEPDGDARLLLERNVALNRMRQIKVEPFAVFDSSGERTFYSRTGDMMCSLERGGFGRNASAPDITESVVQTVSVDEYLAANALPDPAWLKIDAEGAEVNILRGAKRVLLGRTQILCELHPYAWSSFGSSFEELLRIIESAGRTVRFLDDSRDISNGPDYGAVLIYR